jgi:TRAP-type uncharacterized transport system substrate-binding protein
MYETSFQIAALRKSAIRSLADLDGKKVGVGPTKGPAEIFFQAAAEAAQVKPVIVNGDRPITHARTLAPAFPKKCQICPGG